MEGAGQAGQHQPGFASHDIHRGQRTARPSARRARRCECAAVPLGINVESVSGYRNEIDATHVLFRDLQAIVLDEFTAQSGTHWAVRWHPCLPQRSGGVGGRDRSGSTAPRDLAELGNADVCRLALALELGAFVEALRREQIVGEDLADAEFTVASLDDIVEGRAVLKKRFMRRLQELRLNGVPIQLL